MIEEILLERIVFKKKTPSIELEKKIKIENKEFLGGESVAGLSLKSKKIWKNNGNGTNDSGFNVLPVGGRFDNQIFMGEKQRAHFWSSPITKDGRFPFVFVMFGIDSLRFQSAISRGYSIRLIKQV